MSRREEVSTFTVEDKQGNQYRARRVTTFEAGRSLGGGEMPVAERCELADGTLIEGGIDGISFLDRRNGRFFKKV